MSIVVIQYNTPYQQYQQYQQFYEGIPFIWEVLGACLWVYGSTGYVGVLLDEWLRNRRKKFKHIVSVFHACVFPRKACKPEMNWTVRSILPKHLRIKTPTRPRPHGGKKQVTTLQWSRIQFFRWRNALPKKEKVNRMVQVPEEGLLIVDLLVKLMKHPVFCWWNDKTSTGWYSTPIWFNQGFPDPFHNKPLIHW